MINVAIADGKEIVRLGVRRLLEEAALARVRAEASNGTELAGLARGRLWQVLVLDPDLPGGGGLDGVAKAKRAHPDGHVLLYTVRPERALAAAAYRAGASGLLSKYRPAAQLIDAVGRVAKGRPYVPEELAAHFAPGGEGPPHETLSQREQEVFYRLAQGQRPILIARDLNLQNSTVTTYVHRIKKKLGVKSLGEIVRYALEREFGR